MKTQFFTNIWGSDDNLPPLAGNAAEGVISLQASVVYGQDVPGMKVIEMREEEVLAVGCKMDGSFNVASGQPSCGVGIRGC